MADLSTSTGGTAVGGVAGVIPMRGTQLSHSALAPAVSPAASCAEPNCNMPNHGGPVQHAPRVYLVFWGPKWNSNSTHKTVKNYLIAFYKGLGQGADHWSLTESQYPDKTGRPKFGRSLFAGSIVIPTAPPHNVTLTQLGKAAANWAGNRFKIALSNAHNAEIVLASQSGTCFAPAGGLNFAGNCGKAPTATTSGYCAFHTFDNVSNTFLPFVNLPFQLDAKAGCGANFVKLNNPKNQPIEGFSISGGHETAETITDPRENAWVDGNDSISGGEVADKCAWAGTAWSQNPRDPIGPISLSTGNFVVQSLWSNKQQRCVMTGKLPFKVTVPGTQSSTLGKAVSLKISATTTPAVSLTYTATGLPHGLSINRGTGKITGTPGVTAGSFGVKISISYYAGSTTIKFGWKVASTAGQMKGFAGKCVDVSGGHTAGGTKIDLFTCNGSAQQKITFASDNELRVLGKCVTGGTATLKVVLGGCAGAKSQLWVRTASGEYVLRADGKCLTDPANSKTNGTQLRLAACNNGLNQHWSIP